MLDAMSQWEYYLEKDPIFGDVRKKTEALPGALAAMRRHMA